MTIASHMTLVDISLWLLYCHTTMNNVIQCSSQSDKVISSVGIRINVLTYKKNYCKSNVTSRFVCE